MTSYRRDVHTVNWLTVVQWRQLADKSISDHDMLRCQLLLTKQSQDGNKH